MNTNTLRHIHTMLEHHLELTPLFEVILTLFPQLGADFGWLIIREQNDTLHFRSSIAGQEALIGPAGRRFAQRIATCNPFVQTLEQGQSQIIDNKAFKSSDILPDICQSAALVPVTMAKARVHGALLFGRKNGDGFTPADLPFLEMAAWQIGQSIESTYLYVIQAERAAQLALINEVSRAATSILNVGVMLATVTQAVQRSFGFHCVSIFRYLQKVDLFRLDAYTGSDGRTLRPEKTKPLKGILAQAVTSRQTILINDLQKDDRNALYTNNEMVKSRLVIPIRLGVKTIAVLDLESIHLDAFTPPLVSAMEILTDQLAIAIENARLYDELRNKVNELLSLNHIAQIVSSSLDLSQTLTLITKHVTNTLKVAATSVALRDDKAGVVRFEAAFGEGAERVLNIQMPLGTGIAGWVAEKGEPIIVPDVKTDERHFSDIDKMSGFNTQSILCVPLETKGKLIGAIEAMNKVDGSEFTFQDLSLLSDLTAPAATAIENAQLYDELAQNMHKLQELSVFNQNIIENISTGLIALNKHGDVTILNKAAAALLDLRADAIYGQHVSQPLSYFPDLAEILMEPLQDTNAFVQQQHSLILQHQDGRHLTVTVTASALLDADDTVTGVVGLIEDLTELKALEEEGRRLDRLAALGEMSAVVAHELRNPIAGISAGIEYLTKKLHLESTELEGSRMILKEIKRVHRIIEDVMMVARPLDLQKSPALMSSVINTICQRHQTALAEAKIQVHVILNDTLPLANIDAGRMEQVFDNLMSNAMSVMTTGGEITISVGLSDDDQDTAMIILFEDTGSGVTDLPPDKVFEPFFTTKNRGMGLGLALSRRIMEAHGGSIEIAQSNDTGTIFECRLPLT